MNLKMKLENVQLGDIIYFVEDKYPTIVVDAKKVTSVATNREGETIIKVDYCTSRVYFTSWNYHYVGYSKAKAERVLKEMLELKERRRLKSEARKLVYEANEIDRPKLDYTIDKYVMVRTGPNEYRKHQIQRTFSRNKKGVYGFYDGHQSYLFKNEGKNWYYWTRLAELLHQRDELNKEIAKERYLEKKKIKEVTDEQES